jgi:hypothetical protein
MCAGSVPNDHQGGPTAGHAARDVTAVLFDMDGT